MGLGLFAFASSKKASAAGINLIKQFEGFRARAYQDVAGQWTIGYGHLVRPEEKAIYLNATLTELEAENILRQDIAIAEEAVKRLVTVPLSGEQFSALVSFVFNLGQGNFADSTLLKKLNAGDYEGASLEFERWNKARIGGVLQPVAGLTRRRLAEQQLFWA